MFHCARCSLTRHKTTPFCVQYFISIFAKADTCKTWCFSSFSMAQSLWSANQTRYSASNIFHSYATRIRIPIHIYTCICIGTMVLTHWYFSYCLHDEIHKRDYMVRVLQHDINNRSIVAFNFPIFTFGFHSFFCVGQGWCICNSDNHCIVWKKNVLKWKKWFSMR